MTSPAATHPQMTHLPVHGKVRVFLRSVTDLFLVLTWLPATLTGVILWEPLGFVPEGRQRGQQEMLWGLTQGQWGDIHWWLCVAAVAFTALHIALDWKMFKAGMRYLLHRHPVPEHH